MLDWLCLFTDFWIGENLPWWICQNWALWKFFKFYNLNSELLQCDYRPWKQFFKDHTDIYAETASDLVNVLFERELFTFLSQL